VYFVITAMVYAKAMMEGEIVDDAPVKKMDVV
jgi:hypothetical protein